ncbi:dihydrodipicolinate synthase family protein [Aliikangiella sp. IMCC44359]|uniref:dihydrodipicolinate synthase family protein n=1 Tax=Aliikangiella sp. IMCC44359 TaxID=3459125 RepID=UPI00403A8864
MLVSDIQKKSLFTAIKTPFTASGQIDIERYDFLIKQQIKFGVDGVIVGGTTGEGHLLDWEEHLMLISHTVNHYGDDLVVVGNTGSNNTREAIKATKYGFASGMHASLLINPYYGKTTEEGVYQHIKHSLDLGPAFIYNVPGRTGQDIPAEIIRKLASHENFVGVKECAGNERIRQYEQEGIACWSGNDDECFDGRHQYNSHGVISVTSNLVPGIMRELMDNPDSTRNQDLNPLYQWLFDEPNPAPLNTALALTGASLPVIRLPYLPLAKAKREAFLTIIETIESSQVVGDKRLALEDKDFISIV